MTGIDVLAVFLMVCVVLVWLGAVAVLFFRAMDSTMDGTVKVALQRFAVLIVFIAASVAIGLALDDDDTHANQLCVSGHERWTTQHTRSGDYRAKEWVCSAWE